mmetsp:Transcript_29986/g.49511  ORF Transcript_29986/g.49511 Transcript_29986/m.49511 type:complete len:153 (-) Transcript_29986:124-582(-)
MDRSSDDSSGSSSKSKKKGGKKGGYLPTAPPASSCDTKCPCCDEASWPEFVSVIQSFTDSPCMQDCCFSRKDTNSDFLGLHDCDPDYNTLFDYGTAYMSFDFSGARCNGQTACSYCGDSSSNLEVLTADEAAVCATVIQSKIEGSCGSSFPC